MNAVYVCEMCTCDDSLSSAGREEEEDEEEEEEGEGKTDGQTVRGCGKKDHLRILQYETSVFVFQRKYLSFIHSFCRRTPPLQLLFDSFFPSTTLTQDTS